MTATPTRKLPRNLRDEEIPGAGVFNELLDFIRMLTPIQTASMRYDFLPHGYRATAKGRGLAGASYASPPWWPTVRKVSGSLRVYFQPATINNYIPRVDWSDASTEIGQEDGFLTLADGTNGVIASKCSFTSYYDTSLEPEIAVHTSGVPADSVPYDFTAAGFFHIATHLFHTFEPDPVNSPGVYQAKVRPLYFHSLRAVRHWREWRW